MCRANRTRIWYKGVIFIKFWIFIYMPGTKHDDIRSWDSAQDIFLRSHTFLFLLECDYKKCNIGSLYYIYQPKIKLNTKFTSCLLLNNWNKNSYLPVGLVHSNEYEKTFNISRLQILVICMQSMLSTYSF